MHPVGGRRIIDRVATALRDATDSLLLVANAPDAATWLPELRTLRDARPERGSLVGIHTALSGAGGDVVVVAWDMPFVTGALIRLLVERLTTPVYAAVPETSELQPFCAVYSRRCLPLVERALDAGELRVSAFIDSLPVVRRVGQSELETVGDPDRMFFNVNSPADLARAEEMARGA